MKFKSVCSVVVSMSVLALSVFTYDNVDVKNSVQTTNSTVKLDMSEKNVKLPSGDYEVAGENGAIITVTIPEKYSDVVTVNEVEEIITDNNMKKGERLTI